MPADTTPKGHAGHAPADTSHAGHAPPRGSRPSAADRAARAPKAMDRHGEAHGGHAMQEGETHRMLMLPLPGGWQLLGMAQAFPMVTWGAPGEEDSPLHGTEAYLTQPAVMANIESPGSRLVLRTTLNLEALTQPDGEYTFGGWGEGFIDKRHPHTFLHEAMLSLNLWRAAGGSFSLSAGKGFAPYGTDDPMSRPVAKYPTNHHLSQLLERWTLNAIYLRGAWGIEAGIFGGQEPDGPYDLSNIESFGDSYSARLTRRFGGRGTGAAWEASASYGNVREVHHEEAERTSLVNVALRHYRDYANGGLYALVEASRSEPHGEDEGYYSILGEGLFRVGMHRPYGRLEYATRPEYEREGAPGTQGFFRYDHDAHAEGATRWLITSLGYEVDLPGDVVTTRPFIEMQHNRVWEERGGIDPKALFGTDSFFSISAGFRLFFGGGPMRMGSYGVLDDMTTMHRPPEQGGGASHRH